MLLTMCCLPPTLIRNQYKGVVWEGTMERVYAYLMHSWEMRSIESGAVCQSRVESPRDTHRMTANEWRRSRTINESWSNKKGGMVETQSIDSFRVVTSKIIRCHRWIIFLDWRSLIILTQATLSGWFFELVGLGSCCVGGCVWCFTFVGTNVDTGQILICPRAKGRYLSAWLGYSHHQIKH
jgi:hypothetical protein